MYTAFVHSYIHRYINCSDAVLPPKIKYFKTCTVYNNQVSHICLYYQIDLHQSYMHSHFVSWVQMIENGCAWHSCPDIMCVQ